MALYLSKMAPTMVGTIINNDSMSVLDSQKMLTESS